jgi:hypothetical protein
MLPSPPPPLLPFPNLFLQCCALVGWLVGWLVYLFFEAGSHYIAQAGLKLTILPALGL